MQEATGLRARAVSGLAWQTSGLQIPNDIGRNKTRTGLERNSVYSRMRPGESLPGPEVARYNLFAGFTPADQPSVRRCDVSLYRKVEYLELSIVWK